jgi:hypothetical protein
MSTTAEQRVIDFWNSLPHCCGYPFCDGDLEGEPHSQKCPLFGRKELSRIEFAEAYAHSRITSLAEEAEREAEAHYNIAPPHRYHADLDQCKFKRAIAAWLRQKAEEREGSN